MQNARQSLEARNWVGNVGAVPYVRGAADDCTGANDWCKLKIDFTREISHELVSRMENMAWA